MKYIEGTMKSIDMDTTPQTHVLFLDMQEFETLQGVRRRVMQAEKHPQNPIMRLGDLDEWDCVVAAPWASRTVIYDEDEKVFKAWYQGGGLDPNDTYRTGYATSADGIRWQKPVLGLFEYGGNKDNNICNLGWGAVVKDPDEPNPARRYKMMVKGPRIPKSEPVRMNYSPDGIRWTEGEHLNLEAWGSRSDAMGGGKRNPDIIVFMRDIQDPDPARRFKYVWQTKVQANKVSPAGPADGRMKEMAWSADALNWTVNPDNPLISPNDSTEQENHFLMIIPYRGWWIMLYEYGWWLPQRGQKFPECYFGDVRLAVSRDAANYTRIESSQQIIPLGPHGSWDEGMLVMAQEAIIKDDTIYLYYSGNSLECRGMRRRFAIRPCQMGLATLKLDRFTCLETCDGTSYGHAITKPIAVRNAHEAVLILNISNTLPTRSWIEVEVLDAATGQAIDQYTAADCIPLEDDGLSLPVRWKSQSTLAGIRCPKVQLRFQIFGSAKLHSFRFAS